MDGTLRRRIGWTLVITSAVLTVVAATDIGPAGWLAVAILSLLSGIALLIWTGDGPHQDEPDSAS